MPSDDLFPYAHRLIREVHSQLEARFGRSADCITYTLGAILAGGHVLLEDIPGVGKTTFARIISQTMQLKFQRIQFTADLMPSDIIGVEVYLQQQGRFEFRPGPIFHQLVLADELNRASPKTQSALLQAMTDDLIDVGNHQYPLPQPFFIIATQNPSYFEGTYALPESQLDRFMVKLSVGYPPEEMEKRLVSVASLNFESYANHQLYALDLDWNRLHQAVDAVQVSQEVVEYQYDLIQQTRSHPQIRLGLSLRGALSWMRLCKALALIQQRTFVTPDDVYNSFGYAGTHRMVFNQKDNGSETVKQILDTTPFPA